MGILDFKENKSFFKELFAAVLGQSSVITVWYSPDSKWRKQETNPV